MTEYPSPWPGAWLRSWSADLWGGDPRNEGDDPIAPGTGVSAHLATSICEQDSLGGACHEVTVATVKIMVPTEGEPTIEVFPGKSLEE